jgi:hypothetical protein
VEALGLHLAGEVHMHLTYDLCLAARCLLAQLPELQREHCGVRLPGGWLIQDLQQQQA